MEISLDPASGVTLFYQDGMVLTRFPAASSIIGHRFPNALSLTLVLHKLKSLGVQIALDDFGSGYSSLSYLHAFPFGKIKIDRAFVGDLEHNHHSMAIVRAIITLGHSLDVPILAEGGVETEAQRAFLPQEGCDEVQGYLTGRPLSIGAYADLVGREEIAELESAEG